MQCKAISNVMFTVNAIKSETFIWQLNFLCRIDYLILLIKVLTFELPFPIKALKKLPPICRLLEIIIFCQ